MKFMTLLFLIFVECIFSSTSGTLIEYSATMETPLLSKPVVSKSISFVRDKEIRILKKENSLIIIDEKFISVYNDIDSTYFQVATDSMQVFEKQIDAQFAGFKINKNGKTEKIRKWKTEIYQGTIKFMGTDTRLIFYIAPELDYDYSLIMKQQELFFPNSPNLRLMTNEINKIKGFPVKQMMQVEIEGEKLTTEVTVDDIKTLKKMPSKFKKRKKYKKIVTPANYAKSLLGM